MESLKHRIASALVLAPLVIAMVLCAPTWVVMLVAGAFWLVAAWEWAGLLKTADDEPVSPLFRVIYTALAAITTVAVWQLGYSNELAKLACLWWLLALVWVTAYPFGLPTDLSRVLLKGSIGLLSLAAAWCALIILHASPRGGEWTLLLLFIVWAADIGAYFAGRKFGKRKLAPKVSPGKTWAGAIGGAVAGSLIGVLGAYYFGLQHEQLVALLLLTVIVVIFSIVGDLCESMFKRHSGVKDSGHIIPGHGGVLDRIDALLAALPIFYTGWLMFQL